MNVKKQDLIYFTNEMNSEIERIRVTIDGLKNLTQEIENTQLLIPVVGDFSAGKSSLINSFLGSNILPVGITPETSLATEIRYSERNFIQAVKSNEMIDEYTLDDFEIIKSRARDYSYLKLFINNHNVKAIEPLILVDMPGFNSPYDLHNKAITSYLTKGVYFIIIINAETGTITKHVLRRISEIKEFERGMSFFLSKSNLRSQSDINDIMKNIKQTILDELDMNINIEPIGIDPQENLRKVLDAINPETLIGNIFLPVVKSYYFEFDKNINLKIATLKKESAEILEALDELENRKKNVEKKRDELIKDARNRFSNANVNRIVNSISTELSSRSDDLIEIYIKNGEDSFKNEMNEIIRQRLIREVKAVSSEIENELIKEYQQSLKSVNIELSSFYIDSNLFEKISDQIKQGTIVIKDTLNKASEFASKLDKNNKIYKLISTTIAVLTNTLNPVLELLIIFLPEILKLFSGNIEQRKKTFLKNEFLTKVLPKLRQQLHTKIQEIFEEQVINMIENIGKQFEDELTKLQEILTQQKSELDSKKVNIDQEIKLLQSVQKNIREKASNLIFK